MGAAWSGREIAVEHLAAFSDGDSGGNPAGVVICGALPAREDMQAVAREVGYSETVFAAAEDGQWRVRYFAPEIEVPFCGHATIALAAALTARFGAKPFFLQLNDAKITVEGRRTGGHFTGILQSPSTCSHAVTSTLLGEALALFSYGFEDLNSQLPPALAEAGARHLILALRDRDRLAAMRYHLALGRELMLANRLATISLLYSASPTLFHARNAFAAGGVYEDPATGAAAAALAGYLRDLNWPHGGAIEVIQGEDMGMRSRIHAEFTSEAGASIRVSGRVRRIVS